MTIYAPASTELVYDFADGLARHARAARRQGRQHRRDDARARRRPRPRRLHDHDRGMRRLHARRPRGSGAGSTQQIDAGARAARGAAPAGGSATPQDPLLVSVRSGARDSMPGMMDTVLNLGLNDAVGAGPARRAPATSASPGTPTGASCRCSATSCCGVAGRALRGRDRARQGERGVTLDTELDAAALRELTRALPARSTSFPQDPREQLRRAIARGVRLLDGRPRGRLPAHQPRSPTTGAPRSTCSRWCSATRARPPAPASRSRRDEITGAPRAQRATSCVDAQGEDVVSGVRTPRDLAELARAGCPRRTPSSLEILRTLERHYGDMQDTEFTIEEGRLYMLQTRNAKRPAQAAVRFAVDAVDEGLLTRAQAIATIDAERARRAAAPDVRPRRASIEVARPRRRRLAGRGEGRDRLHRRGRRRGRRRGTRR